MLQIKQNLLTRFTVVGVTDRLNFFKYAFDRLILNRTADAAYNCSTAGSKLNEGKHGDVFSYVTYEEYVKVIRRHSFDVELYYWMAMQVEALRKCLGDCR